MAALWAWNDEQRSMEPSTISYIKLSRYLLLVRVLFHPIYVESKFTVNLHLFIMGKVFKKNWLSSGDWWMKLKSIDESVQQSERISTN